jgi:hypothetical protein
MSTLPKLSELGFSVRVANSLESFLMNYGILFENATCNDLERFSIYEIKSFRRVGNKAIYEIDSKLKTVGIKLKPIKRNIDPHQEIKELLRTPLDYRKKKI